MKILVIEDELHTAKDLIRSLTKVDKNIEVVKHTYSVKETVSYLKTSPKINLIFSDIKLVDGNSFEIFNEIETSIPVVFCSAYDEYALAAFKKNGIDYILKPFSQDALKAAVEKYQKLTNTALSHASLQNTIEPFIDNKPRSFQRLLVHQGDKIIPISVDDILLFFIEMKQTFVVTANGAKYILPHSLDEIEKECSHDFFRVNRQAIVNRSAVKEVLQEDNRKMKVVLTNDKHDNIFVGKVKRKAFLDWLKG